jgi:cytochrome c oxidase assembly factor CtaG
MIGWIVLAIVVVSLLVLGVAIRTVTRRLTALRQEQSTLQLRLAQTRRLQERALDVQQRSLLLQEKVALVQHRVGIIKARRAARQVAG